MQLPPLVDPIAQEDPEGYRSVLSNRFQRGLDVAIGDGQYSPMLGRKDYGLYPWESSAKKFGEPDIQPLQTPIAESIAYGSGRLAGTVASDMLRSWYWTYNHPLGIAAQIGRRLPSMAGNLNSYGKPSRVASVLSGFGLSTALDLASGNTDLFNFTEGGRPKGYEALLPSPEDPTKSQNLAVEIPLGYVTGRKGKLLPWDKFHEERPDVTPEHYQHYKDYQSWGKGGLFGLEQQDPLATATVGAIASTGLSAIKQMKAEPGTPLSGKRLAKAGAVGALVGLAAPGAADLISRVGILKGTTSNLEGQPEAQLLGYKVPLTGLLATVGAGAGIYQLNKMAANRAARLHEDQTNALHLAEQARMQETRAIHQEKLQKLAPYQKQIEAMDPHMQDAVRERIAQYENEDFFQSASPEMQSRMAADEARRVARQPEIQQMFGISVPEISAEQQKLVNQATESYRQRNGVK